jgi:acyl carrier protein/uncharacterized membrane protein
MGLEAVELVMELEEAFGVRLEAGEFSGSPTPRMIGDLIFSKLESTKERSCSSQRAFYLLRRMFISTFSLERKTVTPDMPFRNLIPKARERELWQQMKDVIAARQWPALERPLWMSRSLLVVALVIVGLVICASIYSSINTGEHAISSTISAMMGGLIRGIVFVMILAVPSLVVVDLLTRSFRVCIPSRFQSIRDLIPYALTSERLKWTREGVSIVIKRIVMEQFGIKESEYTEDSRFIEDFGMG